MEKLPPERVNILFLSCFVRVGFRFYCSQKSRGMKKDQGFCDPGLFFEPFDDSGNIPCSLLVNPSSSFTTV